MGQNHKSELVELDQTQVNLFFGLGLGKLCGPSPILSSLETHVELKENQRNTSRRWKKKKKKKPTTTTTRIVFGLVCETGFERQLD